MSKALIAGAGGKGGGGGNSPTDDPDTLVSHQYANVIDLVSEGPIEGLVGGLAGVYLNNTPVQNTDGTLNFQGVSMAYTNGLPTQTPIIPTAPAGGEIEKNIKVYYGIPQVQAITSAQNMTRLRVTLAVPSLSYTDTSTGNTRGNSIDLQISLQTGAGAFVVMKKDTITGKCTSRYEREYLIPLTGASSYTLKVERLSSDSVHTFDIRDLYWQSYTTIIDTQLIYPYSALVGLQIDSQYFNSIPSRGYHIKGRQIQVPSNYDPVTLTYTGTWDGTFKVAWTKNPAWIYRDILINPRYGLGKYVSTAQIDKWGLYSIAQYCDQLVADGYGGYEPRFQCNLYLQSPAEAFQVLQDLASVFRGMTYWMADQAMVVQDRPADVTALFAPANVIGGMFTYAGTALKSRHSVCLVTWNDPANQYQQAVEYVEDADAIAKYGVVSTGIVAVGCTSRGQAHRMGLWLLYTEQVETETMTFKTGMEHVLCYPGAVIATTDPSRAGTRFGGRILASTSNSITPDAVIPLLVGRVYSLSCVLPGGAVETHTVTNAVPGEVGPTNPITLGGTWSVPPQEMGVFILNPGDIQPEQWRVLSITEVDKLVAEVSCLKYNPSKYDAVDQGTPLVFLPTNPGQIPVPSLPLGLVCTDSIYQNGDGSSDRKLTLSWKGDAQRYIVTHRNITKKENVITETCTNPTLDILSVFVADAYDFTVTGVNSLGKVGPMASLQWKVPEMAAPSQVQHFAFTRSGKDITFTWDPVVYHGALSKFEIRSNLYNWDMLQPVVWESGTLIGKELPGPSFKLTAKNSGPYRYMIKSVAPGWVYNAVAPGWAYSMLEAHVTVVLSENPITSLVSKPGVFTFTLTAGMTDALWDDDVIQFFGSLTDDRSTASNKGEVSGTNRQLKIEDAQVGVPQYFWARTYSTITGLHGPWYPSDPYAGIACTPVSDPHALITALWGAIGPDQLTSALVTQIGMIDVNQTLTLLHSDFLDSVAGVAISAEALNRANAILDEAMQRGTAITSTQAMITTGLNQLSDTITLLTARVNTNVSALESEAYTRATADSSEASARQTLATRVGAAETAILNETNARSTADLAETLARTTLASTFNDTLAAVQTTLATQASALSAETTARLSLASSLGTTNSQLATESSTRATADSAEASARLALASRVGSVEAAISSESGVRAAADSAEAYQRGLLAAQIDSVSAAVSSEATARASADSAVATTVSQVQARLDTGDFATVKVSANASASALTGISARYTIQVGVNGYIVGTQLINGGVGNGSFTVLADKFLIAKPDGTGAIPMLGLATVGGVTTLGLSGSMIVDGSIATNALAANSVTASKIHGQDLTIYGGGFGPAGSWQAAGGYFLSSSVFRMGAYGFGGFFEVTAAGEITAPGFNVHGGVLTINQLNVINTSNIVDNAITMTTAGTGTTTATVYFTVPAGGAKVAVISGYGGWSTSGSGKGLVDQPATVTVTSPTGNAMISEATLAGGSYSATITTDCTVNASCSIIAIVMKK